MEVAASAVKISQYQVPSILIISRREARSPRPLRHLDRRGRERTLEKDLSQLRVLSCWRRKLNIFANARWNAIPEINSIYSEINEYILFIRKTRERYSLK